MGQGLRDTSTNRWDTTTDKLLPSKQVIVKKNNRENNIKHVLLT